MCDCNRCKNCHAPATTEDKEFNYICPECGGFHLFFDPHAGAVSCHDCHKFNTYGGERDLDECLVKIN